jgi:hypothetical protein
MNATLPQPRIARSWCRTHIVPVAASAEASEHPVTPSLIFCAILTSRRHLRLSWAHPRQTTLFVSVSDVESQRARLVLDDSGPAAVVVTVAVFVVQLVDVDALIDGRG